MSVAETVKGAVPKTKKKLTIEAKIFRPRIHGAGLTDIGGRPNNEDSFYCNDPLRFYLVADGMGGLAGGEMASLFTSVRMQELLAKITTDHDELSLHDAYHPTSAEETLRYALWFTHEELHRASKAQAAADPDNGMMGTTLVAVWVKNDQLIFMNIGDSRAYMIWDGTMHRVTHDNSVVEEMAICEGGLSPEEEKEFGKKTNLVSRSLGTKPKVMGDFYIRPLSHSPARILLCSDGLHGLLDHETIFDCCKQGSVEQACEKLIDLAKIAGQWKIQKGAEKGKRLKYDNVTAVVIDIGNYAFPIKKEADIDNELSIIKD